MTFSPSQTRPLMWINMTLNWANMCKLIYSQILVGSWRYWVSRGKHLSVLGVTGSVLGCTIWYLVPGRAGSVLGCTDWYLVVLGQNRAVLVTSVICSQKINGLHGLNHQIIQYSKKEKVMTDRQTYRISSCRFDSFCRRGRVKLFFAINNVKMW